MTAPLPLAPCQTQQCSQPFTDLGNGAFLLRHFPTQRLHGDDPPSQLVLSQNERELRAALVGALELRLETAPAQIHLQSERRPCIAYLLCQPEALCLRALSGQYQIDV